MKSRLILAGLTAGALAACASPLPSGNQAAPTAQAPQVEAAQPSDKTYHIQAILKVGPLGVQVSSNPGAGIALTDGLTTNASPKWTPEPGDPLPMIVYQLVETDPNLNAMLIPRIRMKTDRMPVGTTYDVQVSTDGLSWTNALTGVRNLGTTLTTKTLPRGTTGKFVRVVFHNLPSGAGVYELQSFQDTGRIGAAPIALQQASYHLTPSLSEIPQNRARGRVRYEFTTSGDAGGAALSAIRTEATSANSPVIMHGEATYRVSNLNVLTDLNTTEPLSYDMLRVPGEAGVLLGSDVGLTQLVEVIWAGVPTPIVRVQVDNLSPAPLFGNHVEVSFTITRRDKLSNRLLTTWTGEDLNVAIPPGRP